jgi:hypothetical protein
MTISLPIFQTALERIEDRERPRAIQIPRDWKNDLKIIFGQVLLDSGCLMGLYISGSCK